MSNCRLLPYRVSDGASNMAADEVLLEAAQGGTASLRFYGWTPATASVGYFQSYHLLQSDPLLACLPFVRRPSGGAALVHHHEITYALALPAGAPWQTCDSWLCRMHLIIAAALSDLGVSTASCSEQNPKDFPGLLCFHHAAPGDLVITTAKVTGSAQRRQRAALLQHGSLLLAASPFTPGLPGIKELTGQTLGVEDTCQAIAEQFIQATGWDLMGESWTTWEKDRIEELVSRKYGLQNWNEKR
jgi:lipoate-protein ligase A